MEQRTTAARLDENGAASRNAIDEYFQRELILCNGMRRHTIFGRHFLLRGSTKSRKKKSITRDDEKHIEGAHDRR